MNVCERGGVIVRVSVLAFVLVKPDPHLLPLHSLITILALIHHCLMFIINAQVLPRHEKVGAIKIKNADAPYNYRQSLMACNGYIGGDEDV